MDRSDGAWAGKVKGGRYGMTIPFDHVPLNEHRGLLEALPELGYTDVWTGETSDLDGLTPLALTACWVPSLRLGTAIISAFTRGPALIAMSVAALAEAAPGRFALGLGTSTEVIVEDWNGIPFDRPYDRLRDLLRFLRKALTGEKVDFESASFQVAGFRLGRPPSIQPPILVAALRPRMLHLARREADGVITNWLSAEDIPRVVAEVGDDKEIVARLFVCPSEDKEAVRVVARRAIAAYLNVPSYAAFHVWLGRGPQLEVMWGAWKAGDRRAALQAIPNEVIDQLIIHGSPAECRSHVQRYVDNGVTTPVLSLMECEVDVHDAIRTLAPVVNQSSEPSR
jgi:probable F420-dependent oxidoreductase